MPFSPLHFLASDTQQSERSQGQTQVSELLVFQSLE